MTSRGNKLFSGEPLPIPPRLDNAEMEAFHRKLIDYLRRLAAKLGRVIDLPPNDPTDPSDGGVGVVESIAVWLEGDASLDTGVPATIDWDHLLWETSDALTWDSESPEFISIHKSGLYVAHLDVGIGKTKYLFELIGGDDALIDHSKVYAYNGAVDKLSFSASVPFKLDSAGSIRVQVTPDSSGLIYGYATRLTVIRLGDFE